LANLQRATEELDRVVARAGTAIDAVGRTANDVDSEIKPLLADLRQSSKSMTAMANEISGLVKENREPLRNFSAGGLTELSSLVTDMREFVAHLDRLTAEIERDPARFLFGNQQQGYDASKKK
jgi:phospholipid/cholesterol/gamma-HCH transport system substrate-binding protein